MWQQWYIEEGPAGTRIEISASSHDSSAFRSQGDLFWRHKLGAYCIATCAEDHGLKITVCTVVD